MAKAKHTIRLISGTHRSRRLPVLDFDGLRPTGDRVRETLFNWLQMNIAGKNILDLFAGSGALGFETASRGAKLTTLVEKNHLIANQLSQITHDFDFKNVKVINTGAQEFLTTCSEKFDVIMIDPPFADNLLEGISQEACKLVEKGGFVYREAAISAELKQLGKNWQLYRQKTFGQVKIELWKKINS